MSQTEAVKYEDVVPDILKSAAATHEVLVRHGLTPALRHLVHLRASQLNRCGFCIKMHLREAREDGETSQRLDRLVVWDQVADFSEREKAALAWTEALTVLDPAADLGALRARLRLHFSDQEIGVLTTTIGMINFWNRVNVSKH